MATRIRPGLSFLFALALIGSVVVASAQTNPANPSIANRPAVVPPAKNPSTDPANTPPRPVRPPVPGQRSPAAGMQDLVREFQSARQAYIKQQHELNLKLGAATEEQRAVIRAQLKETLQQWRELQKQQVREMREQAKDIKNTLNLRDVIDSGSGDGRGR